ncbi:NUDIX hydrolase [Pedococcus bigeumensis]|uniref:NUDIX hydrolase n=1 Tax=Pedococcus bigeumensis TaxID=433644 RepID=UPI002FEDC6EA
MDAGQVNETPRHSVSVAAAIFDDAGQNVLLIKRRDNGNWEPPGGVLELDETIEDGLRREVREETGAEIEVGPLTGVYKNMTRGIVALVFRAKLESEPKSSSNEASEVRWMPLELLPKLMAEAYALRLTDADPTESVARRPSVREHDGTSILSDGGRREL